jgi:hypothetical protein
MANVLLGIDNKGVSFRVEPERIGDKVEITNVLGTYLTEKGYYFRFEERGGELFLLRSGRNDTKLIRESDNAFHQWNDDAFKQEFTRNQEGEMQVTAYYPTVPPFTLTKPESDWINYDYSALNGKYVNNETNVEVEIKHISDKQYQVRRMKQKWEGVLVRPNELLVNDYSIKIEMNDDSEVKQLFLTSGRIQQIRLERK